MRLFNIKVNGQAYEVEVEEIGGSQPVVRQVKPAPAAAAPAAPATAATAAPAGPAPAPAPSTPAPQPAAVTGGEAITSPMPGKIQSIAVKVGDKVNAGDLVLILEAMKMDNEIFSNTGGEVKDIRVAAGAAVNPGDVLVVIG
ncbi:MAG: biotin/lipoyl-containing protein [Clostridiales bacterium]